MRRARCRGAPSHRGRVAVARPACAGGAGITGTSHQPPSSRASSAGGSAPRSSRRSRTAGTTAIASTGGRGSSWTISAAARRAGEISPRFQRPTSASAGPSSHSAERAVVSQRRRLQARQDVTTSGRRGATTPAQRGRERAQARAAALAHPLARRGAGDAAARQHEADERGERRHGARLGPATVACLSPERAGMRAAVRPAETGRLCSKGARCTPASVTIAVMLAGGRDIEGGIRDGGARGREHRASELGDLVGSPLLDGDPRPARDRVIDRRGGSDDVAGHAVGAREHATATPRTRSARTRSRCSRAPTACRATSSRPPRRSITRSQRRGNPHRGARGRRGGAARRARARARGHGRLEPRLRRHAGGQHHRDRDRGRACIARRSSRACRLGGLTACAQVPAPIRHRHATGPRPSLAPCHARLAPPPPAAASLRRLPRAGRLDVRRLRPAAARARGAAVHTLRRARPRSVVTACRACSRLRWLTTARSALWLERPGARARGGAGSAARSRPRGWPRRWSRTSCRDPRSRRSPSCPPCATGGCCAAPIRPRSWRPSSARWWDLPVVPLVRRARGVRPQRGLDAARAPPQRARRVRRPRRPAPRWRSSTTSTRPAPRSTSAPARCAGRARSRCTSSRSRARRSIGPLRERRPVADS